MEDNKKVSLVSTVLFTVCGVLTLDSFVAPAMIGVSAISVWIIAAVVFFIPYGLLSAELGSSFPDDGGIVSWVGRAFGEFPSVLVGWMYWINVAFWMPAVFVAFSGWLSIAVFPGMSLTAQAAIAVAMCWVIVFIGVRGIELSVTVSGVMAVVKMGILVVFGAMGVAYGLKFGFANDFSVANWIPGMDNAVSYVGAIVYNLLGFELIGSIGSRIHDPRRTVPRMTVIAGSAITLLYCFGTFGVLAAINAADIDAVDGFVYALRELCSVFGRAAAPVFYALIVLSVLSLVANMITWCLGANEAFQAAELDRRSKLLAHRHPRYGTSDMLYYIMGAVASALIVLNFLFSGSANDIFWTIFSFSSIVFMLNYLFMFPAALKLKYTDPTPRNYEVPGGKAGMWICSVVCFLCVALACWLLIDWDTGSYGFWMQLIGVALTIGVGCWLYAAGKKRA